MAMLKRAISIVGRTRGGLSYRSLSSEKSLNLVDTLEIVKGLEAQNVPTKQAEALTRAITGGLESVMEKVKADIAKSEENHSTRVVEEVQKLRADIDKMRDEQRYLTRDHDIRIHRVEQDSNKLRVDFEATKYQAVKYATYTVASTAVAGFGMLCLMT